MEKLLKSINRITIVCDPKFKTGADTSWARKMSPRLKAVGGTHSLGRGLGTEGQRLVTFTVDTGAETHPNRVEYVAERAALITEIVNSVGFNPSHHRGPVGGERGTGVLVYVHGVHHRLRDRESNRAVPHKHELNEVVLDTVETSDAVQRIVDAVEAKIQKRRTAYPGETALEGDPGMLRDIAKTDLDRKISEVESARAELGELEDEVARLKREHAALVGGAS